jgi:hypothetical protein
MSAVGRGLGGAPARPRPHRVPDEQQRGGAPSHVVPAVRLGYLVASTPAKTM